MASETPSPHQVPVIDFSGLDAANPGTQGWIVARAQVMQALESCGCFEAVCHEITPELREAVFGGVMKEVFGLSTEAKMRSNLDNPFPGYIGGIAGLEYESLSIYDAARPEGIEKFAGLMWPQGNPSFCATTSSFTKILSKLDQIVRRMVLESLGVEKYSDSAIGSSFLYNLRLAEYGPPYGQGTKISFPAHTDPTIVSLVCQHHVEGLEIRTKDGEWIKPSQDSITFLAGETLMAWTNGRLVPPLHRVAVSGDDTRYSAIFGSHPKEGCAVQALEELVDDEHPLQYKPFDYQEYLQFRLSLAGKENHQCTLKAFCGV